MDVDTLLYLKWITSKDLRIAQGTLLSVAWRHGWKGVSGKNGYMYTYDFDPLLSTWNYQHC